MIRPQITRELDRAGFESVPFRVLAHAAHCADRHGAATVIQGGIVTTCGRDADATQDALRALEAAELLRIVWDGERAYLTLTGVSSGPYTLIVPGLVAALIESIRRL